MSRGIRSIVFDKWVCDYNLNKTRGLYFNTISNLYRITGPVPYRYFVYPPLEGLVCNSGEEMSNSIVFDIGAQLNYLDPKSWDYILFLCTSRSYRNTLSFVCQERKLILSTFFLFFLLDDVWVEKQ
ncbi:hypothetical protein PHYBLDRAFT_59311 [Phycomyces blakesleeanus NRRL 1555(-)]|uniref:Uncharacterized protein n=1 Tax=Phycomyces blakesleeanus (strain ATCC 8743b / DSM 1359 / FGSC 10004 / NBRC 33097 / NRRL 1555) TaxID=763407 RepID=A0A167NFF3_PHYB8|nr:hypothetical protein PHYBLDRAFT_59311 [Phycomyces blakesleeanus NRRL 1555(-)]OAD75778.1 hypothetical protein PHYBLDRAFT_59311 [Phycomyces blakesleeanus NRRL 1555(-)]|eukprot:XP_018293818.1 hypothetical protein PHYBLDRAFT_59311 [Phycomyces blakesleeanus NRRL 1555(-)]